MVTIMRNCSFMVIVVSPVPSADNGHSMDDYSDEFLTDKWNCAALGVKETKDCESENRGHLTIKNIFSPAASSWDGFHTQTKRKV